MVRAANRDTLSRDLSATVGVVLAGRPDRAAGLTRRRVVDLGRTGSTRCRVSMPGR